MNVVLEGVEVVGEDGAGADGDAVVQGGGGKQGGGGGRETNP